MSKVYDEFMPPEIFEYKKLPLIELIIWRQLNKIGQEKPSKPSTSTSTDQIPDHDTLPPTVESEVADDATDDEDEVASAAPTSTALSKKTSQKASIPSTSKKRKAAASEKSGKRKPHRTKEYIENSDDELAEPGRSVTTGELVPGSAAAATLQEADVDVGGAVSATGKVVPAPGLTSRSAGATDGDDMVVDETGAFSSARSMPTGSAPLASSSDTSAQKRCRAVTSSASGTSRPAVFSSLPPDASASATHGFSGGEGQLSHGTSKNRSHWLPTPTRQPSPKYRRVEVPTAPASMGDQDVL